MISPEAAETKIGEAKYEPMQHRLRIEAPGGPQTARFLNVLQGADAGTAPTPVTLIQSFGETAFAGALVGKTVVLFPVDIGMTPAGVSYTVPASTTTHLITGLTPNGGYDVTLQKSGNDTQVTVKSGNTYKGDAGGVLVVRPVGP